MVPKEFYIEANKFYKRSNTSLIGRIQRRYDRILYHMDMSVKQVMLFINKLTFPFQTLFLKKELDYSGIYVKGKKRLEILQKEKLKYFRRPITFILKS